MLEKHVKARKANRKAEFEKQARLDEHLRPLPEKKRVVPYSDELFNEAAREWLIDTDQVCFVRRWYRSASVLTRDRTYFSPFKRCSILHSKT